MGNTNCSPDPKSERARLLQAGHADQTRRRRPKIRIRRTSPAKAEKLKGPECERNAEFIPLPVKCSLRVRFERKLSNNPREAESIPRSVHAKYGIVRGP